MKKINDEGHINKGSAGDDLPKFVQKSLQYINWLGPLFGPVNNLLKRVWRKLRRFGSLLLPGRVSRIHYYEAKERYESLRSMLEYYKNIEEEDNDKGEKKEKLISINDGIKLLDEASMYITRKQKDLNILWRKLTRVRIMLVEKVLPSTLLPCQIDFCHEEAFRLAVSNDTEVKERLHRLAELVDAEDPEKNKDKMCRVIRALLEHFNTIRTGRIHQQFLNIRTYQIALLILLPISILLINSWELMLTDNKKTIDFPPEFIFPDTEGLLYIWYFLKNFALYIYKYARGWIESNILAFVFFGGLAGGFFSATIRLRDRDMIPGEDVYFIWYVLTKPFVGAVGAVVLYILVQAGLYELPLFKKLENVRQGALAFSFAFLSGFSERIILPRFGYSSRQSKETDAK